MAVDHVRADLGDPHDLHDGLAEEDETGVVVLKIALAVAVELAPVEELLAANKIDRETLFDLQHPHIARVDPVSHFHAQTQPLLRRRHDRGQLLVGQQLRRTVRRRGGVDQFLVPGHVLVIVRDQGRDLIPEHHAVPLN